MWGTDDEEFLLELWAASEPQLRGSRKNGHIYKEMSKEFEGRPMSYSAEEIKMKLHNLTTKYKKEKQIIGPSGGSPSEWALYNKVHSILGGHRIHNLEFVVEDSRPSGKIIILTKFMYVNTLHTLFYILSESISNSSGSTAAVSSLDITVIEDHEYSECSNKENPLSPSPDEGASTSKAKKRKICGEKLKAIDEELLKHSKEESQKSLRIEEEKLACFKEFVADAKKFNASVLDILRKNK
ncbi:uncharacterized protein LOC129919884 isoform X1 [Episyrphus balteatus]|uniref:uncharacterized protein LOC129919884 isoform X1 n=1 Tax=Episyrphus balteatus TaxID=286459 RepID=UPI00248670CF|nr:uncharacterized protein LOC129919884 isoform X1 [Episyrphus balteatus]